MKKQTEVMIKTRSRVKKGQNAKIVFALLLCLFLILSGSYLADHSLKSMIYAEQHETRYQQSISASRQQFSHIVDQYISPLFGAEGMANLHAVYQYFLQICKDILETVKNSLYHMLGLFTQIPF